MRVAKQVKAELIIPFVKELVDQGRRVRITITGSSMYPFLREGIDSVELTACMPSIVKRGDIVLFRRDNGQFILHRVLRKTDEGFYFAGDAQQWIEGPVYGSQLIAAAAAIYRKEFRISCNSCLWKAVSFLWLVLLPFRYHLLGGFRKLRRFMKHGRQGGALS